MFSPTVPTRSRRAYTLVELAASIAIIAILLAIGLVVFLGNRVHAQDRQAQSALRNTAVSFKAAAADLGGDVFPDLATLWASDPAFDFTEDASTGPDHVSTHRVGDNVVVTSSLSHSGTCWVKKIALNDAVTYGKSEDGTCRAADFPPADITATDFSETSLIAAGPSGESGASSGLLPTTLGNVDPEGEWHSFTMDDYPGCLLDAGDWDGERTYSYVECAFSNHYGELPAQCLSPEVISAVRIEAAGGVEGWENNVEFLAYTLSNDFVGFLLADPSQVGDPDFSVQFQCGQTTPGFMAMAMGSNSLGGLIGFGGGSMPASCTVAAVENVQYSNIVHAPDQMDSYTLVYTGGLLGLEMLEPVSGAGAFAVGGVMQWDCQPSPATLTINSPDPWMIYGDPAPSSLELVLGDFGDLSEPLTAQLAFWATMDMEYMDGCDPEEIPAGSVTGKIALVEPGGCTYSTKVRNLQNAGAVAVLLVSQNNPVHMGQDGTPNQPTIPAATLIDYPGHPNHPDGTNGISSHVMGLPHFHPTHSVTLSAP